MPAPTKKMVWITANRDKVGGPSIGFTLMKDHCYQVPEDFARDWIRRGWATEGKERRQRRVLK